MKCYAGETAAEEINPYPSVKFPSPFVFNPSPPPSLSRLLSHQHDLSFSRSLSLSHRRLSGSLSLFGRSSKIGIGVGLQEGDVSSYHGFLQK
ncbi:hypothetical protein I3842_01G039800 [Carya illinoinensis]|uniref:Uncharacterized protein n=1 Tax=Carya illinoinensis TaxID=32201 RepID=A0A922FZG1_CARIL|nr:hypothetical protein I3842_01G039800 [Carya illinoinensis]